MVVPWPSPPPSPPTRIPDVGLRGISIRQLRKLADYLKRLCKTGVLLYPSGPEKGQPILWTCINMSHICNAVVKPVIEHLGVGSCSWVELVASGPQAPRIFVSHSWSEPFREFMATAEHLVSERGMTARDVLWICTFANNQFDISLGTRLLESPFFTAFARAEATALFLDRTSSSLSRSWCTFELAVTTDTPEAKRRWQAREELARKDGVDQWEVTWEKVESHLRAEQEPGRGAKSKPLFLCTAGGLVGTRCVTSGPVLESLQTLNVAQAEASQDADRRRIMNYIAYSYYSDSGEDRELSGLVAGDDGRLHLADTALEQSARRANGRAEYAYEHALVTEVAPDRFRLLGENIRYECQRALQARGLVEQRPSGAGGLQRTYFPPAGAELPVEHRALTLAQLRVLQAMLCQHVSREGRMSWEHVTSHHLWPADGPGLLRRLLPAGCSVCECFQSEPQHPEFFVTCPYDMRLADMFAAIEWHAEARGMPDRATYFLDPFAKREGCFCDMRPVLAETSTGHVVLLDRGVTRDWRSNRQSLWCLYELFLADSLQLGCDLTCSTGALATVRPFPSGAWMHGHFDHELSLDLVHLHVQAETARCSVSEDKTIIMGELRSGAGGIEGFNNRLNTVIPSSVLGPALLHAARLDAADAGHLCELGAKVSDLRRCGAHVNPMALRGTFGETPLHVLASSAAWDGPGAEAELDALLGTGMDLDAQDEEGETPLHWAAFAGKARAVESLLRRGANPRVRSYCGELPADVAGAGPADFLPVVRCSLPAAPTSS